MKKLLLTAVCMVSFASLQTLYGQNMMSTLAGVGPEYMSAGYSGDGGPATLAALNNPSDICLDTAYNIYIADMGNHVVRKINAHTGIITTIAGNGTSGYSGDGGASY